MTDPERMRLPKLVHKHALIQAEEAGLSPTAGKVLAYLAERVNYWRPPVDEIPRAQTFIAKQIGVTDRGVRKVMPKLIEAGLLIDLDHGLRNKQHRYKVTLDWSFSEMLSARQTAVEEPDADRPPLKLVPPVRQDNSKRQPGQHMRSRQAGNCNFCDTYLGENEGEIVKFQTHHLLFCNRHWPLGEQAAQQGWPEGKSFPRDREAQERFRLYAVNGTLSIFLRMTG